MPALIIATQPDGTILVNALPEAPPEMMEGAQPAESLEEAASMVNDVLGAQQTGEEPTEGEDRRAEEGEDPSTAQDAMTSGFDSVRGRKTY
jgi:hypothetical protein